MSMFLMALTVPLYNVMAADCDTSNLSCAQTEGGVLLQRSRTTATLTQGEIEFEDAVDDQIEVRKDALLNTEIRGFTSCDYPPKPEKPRDISTLSTTGGNYYTQRTFCESLCFLKMTGKCSAGGYVRDGCLGFYTHSKHGTGWVRCAEQSQSKKCHPEIKSNGKTAGNCPSDVDLSPNGELCRNAVKPTSPKFYTVDDAHLKATEEGYMFAGKNGCTHVPIPSDWRGSHTVFKNTCGDLLTRQWADPTTKTTKIDPQGLTCSARQLGICPSEEEQRRTGEVCCENKWGAGGALGDLNGGLCMAEKDDSTQFWDIPSKCPKDASNPDSWTDTEKWWADHCTQSCQLCPEGSYTPNLPSCPDPAPAGHEGASKCVDLWIWRGFSNCPKEAAQKCPDVNPSPSEAMWWTENCKATCGLCPEPCNVKAPPDSPARYSDVLLESFTPAPPPTLAPATTPAPMVHTPSACLEHGKYDSDCCAKPADAGCKDGYDMTVTNSCWGNVYFYIECIPSANNQQTEADLCDEASWPDKDHNLVCGDCKVLVDNFDKKYKTCDGYCESVGLLCANAWEEEDDDCRPQYDMPCDAALKSSDALCECKLPTATPTESPTKSPTKVEPKGKCKSSCEKSANGWKQKCKWKNCKGCSTCLPVSSGPCKSFCGKNKQPWAAKCSSFKACTGCPECS